LICVCPGQRPCSSPGKDLNRRPLGGLELPARTSECLWSALVASIYTEIGWLPTSPLYRLPRVVSAAFGLYLMGFRWAIRWGGSNRETCPEEFPAPVVTGCLLLSPTVFQQFGVFEVDPEFTVDRAATEAHLRCMTSRVRGARRALSRLHRRSARSWEAPRSRRPAGTGRPVPGTPRGRTTGAGDSPGPGDRS
jgi:hypothetical protein